MTTDSSQLNHRECFVIMKYGKKDSAEYQRQRSLYEDVIKPAVEEAGSGYKCVRADDIMRPTAIVRDIVKHLWRADVVIADLTAQNPNVFYELGVRHALKGRTIMLTQSMDDVPFDVRNYRVIEYSPDSPSGFRKVTLEIRRHLDELRSEPELSDSPVLDCLPSRPVIEGDTATSGDHGYDRDLRLIKSAIEGLGRRFDSEVASRLQIVGEISNAQRATGESLSQIITQLRPNLLNDLSVTIEKIHTKLDEVAKSDALSHIVERFGLVSIHRTRLDAIERSFYEVMENENRQIDVVGSTIYGLRGNSWVNTQKILDLFRSKLTSDPKFVLRILLTHYDCLASRMDQERSVKTPGRYVISREAVTAIEELRKRDLLDRVRFYKGAPTCFTIVCHSQKQMLLNTYPYEREGYSSWAIVFREIPAGIYQDFLLAHIEGPWENPVLTEHFSESYESRLREKAGSDLDEFVREAKAGTMAV